MRSNENLKTFSYLSANREENFVILLPIINAIATIFVPYTSGSSINIGIVRAFLIGIFGLHFIISRYKNQFRIEVLTLIFIFYFLILIFIGQDIVTGLNVYLKFFVANLHLLFGIHYAKRPLFLKRISISILIMLSMYLIDFIFSNIFHFGLVSYAGVENEINFGGLGVNMAKCIASILLMLPIIYPQFSTKISKQLIIILAIAGTIQVLFAFKRSGIASLFLGYILILLFYPDPIKSIRLSLKIILFGVLLSPFIYNQIQDNYQAREAAIRLDNQENLEKQARYVEYQRTLHEFQSQGIVYKLFGSELFNSRLYFKQRRTFHTDYMTLLAGSGLVGISLLILHYTFIIRTLKKKFNLFPTNNNKLQFSVGLALTFSMLLFGLSGLIQSIEPRATILLFIGTLIGRPVFAKN